MSQLEWGDLIAEASEVTYKEGDRFDVADIDFRFPDTGKTRHTASNRLIDKLCALGKGKYELRIPPEPELPCVKNLKTGNEAKLNEDRNQYDAWAIGGVTIAPHKLIGFLCIENRSPNTLDVVHHINDDKKDFRLSNLMWVSNGANVSASQKKKKEREYLLAIPFGFQVY